MSHFTVMVIDTKGEDTVDEQLAPYDENKSVAPYIVGDVSEDNGTVTRGSLKTVSG